MKLKILLLLFFIASVKGLSAQDQKPKDAPAKTLPAQKIKAGSQPKDRVPNIIEMIYKDDPSFFQEAPKPFQDGAKQVIASTTISITNNEKKDVTLRFFNTPDSVCKNNPSNCSSFDKKIAKGKFIIISNADIKTLLDSTKPGAQKIFFKDIADSTKWGVIHLTYDSVGKPSGPTIPCEPINDKYFVMDMPSAIKAKYRAGVCYDCDQKNDYVINYDLSTGPPVLSFYKRKQGYIKCDQNPGSTSEDASICSCNSISCQADHLKHLPYRGFKKVYYYTQKTKIRPVVGKNIGFRIYGYKPDFDSLGFQVSYVSRNQEQQDNFSKLITPSAPKSTGTDSSTTEKDVAKAIAGGKDLKPYEYITILKNELQNFLSQLVYNSKSRTEVRWVVDNINDRFLLCFHVVISSADDIEKWGESAIAKAKLPDERAIIFKGDLLAAMRFYNELLHYSPDIKIPTIQVQNEDMMMYDVKYYSNGKLKFDTPYSLLIAGGLKIDFSTGITATSLVDKDYAVLPIGTDSIQIIKKSGGKDISLGLALMSHIYARAGRRTNLGFGAGFMFDTNAAITKYLVGGSLMLGHEQRFIFNYGLAVGQVKTLADGFDLEKSYLTSSNTSLQTAIPTKDIWDTGWFFGLSYNLGGATLSKK